MCSYDSADRQPTVSLGSESETSTMIHPSPSSVTARRMERSDVKSVKSTLVKSGPMPWVGTREKSPSRKVRQIHRFFRLQADTLDGWANFSCSAESVSVWTKTDARGREEFKKD